MNEENDKTTLQLADEQQNVNLMLTFLSLAATIMLLIASLSLSGSTGGALIFFGVVLLLLLANC